MGEILVLVEHRKGELRDVTFELLGKGRQLAEANGGELVAAILGRDINTFASSVARFADRVLVVEDEALRDFNSDAYQMVLSRLIRDRNPVLTLIAHSAFGLDLAPSLATELDAALATDCVDIDIVDNAVKVIRPIYGGKVRANVALSDAPYRIATLQSGSASSPAPRSGSGEIVTVPSLLEEAPLLKRFLEYIDVTQGEVDISQADIIVSVGRGIGDPKNLPLVEDLANALGATLACSRPVVDKKWLPKARQVGISGKTVQPKLYLAIGISGAFQHVSAIKRAGMVVAINKDPEAPIFRVADYGIVGDLFTIVPVLKDKILKARGRG